MLCKDNIIEITKYCNQSTIASLLSINKFYYNISHSHEEIKKRRMLNTELNKTKITMRKYYKSEVFNFKIGDRITDRIKNYKVIEIKKRNAILEVVDMYGRGTKEYTDSKIYNIKNHKMNHKNNSFWSTFYYDEYNQQIIINQLVAGIIKHDYGPLIKSLDSHYLKYITKPLYIYLINDDIEAPELNMLVTVYYNWKLYEYYIDKLDDMISINIVNKEENIESNLKVYFVNNKWVIKNTKYKLVYFGGWNKDYYKI